MIQQSLESSRPRVASPLRQRVAELCPRHAAQVIGRTCRSTSSRAFDAVTRFGRLVHLQRNVFVVGVQKPVALELAARGIRGGGGDGTLGKRCGVAGMQVDERLEIQDDRRAYGFSAVLRSIQLPGADSAMLLCREI